MITTIAPAKINWALEVLGKRDDGYHEVGTILQTIELHDEIRFEPADELHVEYVGRAAPEEDLVLRAAMALREEAAVAAGARISVVKRVPEAAGLGGGSSDAAATLRGLALLWGIKLETGSEVAIRLGSDVPFFLTGGTALAEGRGERVTALPDVAPTWLVVVVPPISVPEKTRRMYQALRADDFSDGARSRAVSEAISSGEAVEDAMLQNSFERVAYEAFEGLAKYRDWMLEAGARAAHLCGSGPALFAIASGEAEARAMRARMTRPKAGERVYAVRTITAAEATLAW